MYTVRSAGFASFDRVVLSGELLDRDRSKTSLITAATAEDAATLPSASGLGKVKEQALVCLSNKKKSTRADVDHFIA